MIHKDLKNIQGTKYERRAARGIILDGNQALLLYTKNYNDYSFPGGGVDPSENLIEGLYRELAEEVGARNIKVLGDFGYIDEYIPHTNPDYDLIHMVSYFYVCKAYIDFKSLKLEDYEIANGVKPVWINIHEAIAHNKKVMESNDPSMGFCIERETLVLELVAEEILKGQASM